MDFAQVLKSWVLLALGVLLAAGTASGIYYDQWDSLVFAVILLSVCNIFLKPLLMLFSLPFIIITFGIGIWLINALLFLLVGALVGGFHVETFFSALWGALVVSLTGGIANILFGASKNGVRGRINVQVHRGGPPPGGLPRGDSAPRTDVQKKRKPLKDDDDVIDI